MFSKLFLLSLGVSSIDGFGLWWNKNEEKEKEKYDLDHEDGAYIYDRSHGDDDVHKRKKDALEWLQWEFPFLKPNHNSKEGDLHAIDKDHLVDEAFRLSFKQIVSDAGYRYQEYDVVTKDGYVLKMFRVRHKETPEGAPAVLL
jgi:hypothetical protein